MADKPKNANTAAANAAPRVEPKIVTGALPTGFTPPAPSRGGGNTSKYPFDSLEVGGAFGVKNKTRRQMMSPLNNAKKKYRTELTGADGKVVKNQERDFYSVDVTPEIAETLKGSDFEGSSVLIVRSK